MATSRTLKLGLLADVAQFGRGMAKAANDTKSMSSKMDRSLKRAGAAFTALGVSAAYAAVKIGVDSVKAAVEDEASQAKLAKALKNTTNATDSQINSTEKWITKQQLAYGVSDTKLRPALANLTRATKDVKNAQDLTNLSMDISAATGRDVETVSLALAKAYNGNFGALTKLGVPLDKNIIATKDFDAATKVLSETFAGSAATAAGTYAGKMARVKEALGEAKETLGAAFLPYVEKFADYATNTLIPTLQQVADGFAGKPKSISNKVAQVGRDLGYAPDSGSYNLGAALRDVADSFGKLFNTMTGGDASDSISTMQQIADSLERIADGIDAVSNAWDNPIFKAIRSPFNIGNIKEWGSSGGQFGGLKGKAVGGSVRPGTAYRVGEFGPETLVMGNTGGRVLAKGQGVGGGNTFIFNGVIDGESARRSIERLMQNSSRRTGAVNLVGGTL